LKIIMGLKGIRKPLKGSVVTIGVFDGIHVGHEKIIRRTVRQARRLHLKSVLLTFDPHPFKILDRTEKVPSLISLKHRISLIGSLGVDYTVVLKFTEQLSRLSSVSFVKNILLGKLGMKEICVGENFYFGSGAKAGIPELKEMGERLSFKVEAIRPVMSGSRVVSSSLIRRLIIKGDIRAASKFLGRPVSILGTVVSGDGRGRLLGFPTANIDPHHEAIPPGGVYAVLVRLDKDILKGVLNIGLRPTFFKYSPEPEPSIEVHILDFNRDIYDKDLEIMFICKLRDEAHFKDECGLMAQIKKDVKRSRAILRRVDKKAFTNKMNCVNIFKSK